MHHYILEPQTPEELRARVDAYLEMHGGAMVEPSGHGGPQLIKLGQVIRWEIPGHAMGNRAVTVPEREKCLVTLKQIAAPEIRRALAAVLLGDGLSAMTTAASTNAQVTEPQTALPSPMRQRQQAVENLADLPSQMQVAHLRVDNNLALGDLSAHSTLAGVLIQDWWSGLLVHEVW
jgi:hypothetical protein